MSVEKIGKIEAIALILIVVINEIVLNIPNIIILSTGSGTSINIIFVSILAVIFTYIICKLFKPFLGKDILDISEYVGGKTLKTIVGILFMLFFVVIASLSVKFFANFIKSIYFNSSPIVFILLFFLIPALFINKFGIKAISGVNLIFAPILILSLAFLLVSSYNNFTIERIFPLFGNSFLSTFVLGSTNIFAFSGLAYLYFMPSLLKDAKDFKKVSMVSIILSAICLVFSIISLMMSFPAVATTDETISLYLLTRMIKFGNFIERLDAIFIFLWIVSLISFLSLTFFYILRIFKRITKIEDSKGLIYSLGLITLGNCLAFKNISIIKFLARIVCKYYVLALVFGISFIILIVANIKYKRNCSLEVRGGKCDW
ncbi:MAG: GerAB/ArcD/ProY family transporter [Clostridia bacterium]